MAIGSRGQRSEGDVPGWDSPSSAHTSPPSSATKPGGSPPPNQGHTTRPSCSIGSVPAGTRPPCGRSRSVRTQPHCRSPGEARAAGSRANDPGRAVVTMRDHGSTADTPWFCQQLRWFRMPIRTLAAGSGSPQNRQQAAWLSSDDHLASRTIMIIDRVVPALLQPASSASRSTAGHTTNAPTLPTPWG